MTVKPLISPARALAYKPFTSRCSQTSNACPQTPRKWDLRCLHGVPSSWQGCSRATPEGSAKPLRHLPANDPTSPLGARFVAIDSRKAQIAVETVANVVTVEHIGETTGLDKSFLHSNRDAGLSRTRQAREPHRCPALTQSVPTLRTREMPPGAKRCCQRTHSPRHRHYQNTALMKTPNPGSCPRPRSRWSPRRSERNCRSDGCAATHRRTTVLGCEVAPAQSR